MVIINSNPEIHSTKGKCLLVPPLRDTTVDGGIPPVLFLIYA